MDSPSDAFQEYDANPNEVKIFNGVMAHVVGTLVAWSLGLLIWLMYRLWQDYISTILTAFIVSQTLHTYRAQLVGGLKWLRSQNSPPLRSVVLSALRPMTLMRACLHGPAVLQLGLLLAFFLVVGAVDSIYNRLLILLSLAGPALALLLATVVLDKRLLMFNALVSDEVLAATLVLATIITVLSFVAISLSVQSVLDAVQLLYAGSTWIQGVSEGAAAPLRDMTGQAVGLARHGLESLRRAEHHWVPVATHLLEQIDSSSSNGSVVVMSTFDKLREVYPDVQWLEQAQDLGRLVLWAAHRASGAAAAAGAGAATAAVGDLLVASDSVSNAEGAGGSFLHPSQLNYTNLAEEGRKLLREMRAELHNPAELMTMLRSQVVRLGEVLPSLRTSVLGSQLMVLISSLLSLSFQLLHLTLALSGTTIVFLTMTFYMLSSEKDVLTLLVRTALCESRWVAYVCPIHLRGCSLVCPLRLCSTHVLTTLVAIPLSLVQVNNFHPAAQTATLQRMRDTIDAAITMPIAGAARNAIFELLLFWTLGLPCKSLAALSVIVATLFPLVYAWFVCLPWCVALLVDGRWLASLVLLVLNIGILSGHSEGELRLQEQTGIGDYVHAFSLVLGVYVFGVQGVLFGPMLVCVAKLLSDMVSEVIRGMEGKQTESPPPQQPGAGSGGSLAPPPLANRRHAGVGGTCAPAAAGPAAAPSSLLFSGGKAASSAHPAQRSDVWSRAQGHVLGTMRRLSFFSSPGATPVHYGIQSGRQRAAHLSGAPSLQRSQSYPNPMPFSSPPPSAAGVDLRGADVAITVSTVGGPTNTVATTAPLRVVVSTRMDWAALLKRVESRLSVAGALPPQHVVAGLRAADRAQLVSAEDIREGDALEAELAPIRHTASTPSAAEGPPLIQPGADADTPVPAAALFKSPLNSPDPTPRGAARKRKNRLRTSGASVDLSED